ncbi:hypothetical protein ACIQH6_28875 [Micromonospora orduensis]|uniref:hypothetical protein n=1 Tax=Micromonospora orduensis TaxID=1420891 RepID=UPI0038135134
MPPYLQLVQQVRQAVLLGFLQPGDRLPLIREVVEDLVEPNGAGKTTLLRLAVAAGLPEDWVS